MCVCVLVKALEMYEEQTITEKLPALHCESECGKTGTCWDQTFEKPQHHFLETNTSELLLFGALCGICVPLLSSLTHRFLPGGTRTNTNQVEMRKELQALVRMHGLSFRQRWKYIYSTAVV